MSHRANQIWIDSSISSKPCNKCKEKKILTDFGKNWKHTDGYHNTCKKCTNEFMRKDRIRRPDAYRNSDYKKMYGITLDQYKEMVDKQNGVCAICGCTETRKLKYLHIDHNHSTGKVRGLLCVNCNIGIGNFKENINFMKSAIKYLEGGQSGEC
jgi:hypothetical protein